MSEPTTAPDIMLRLLHHWSPFQELVVPNCCLPGWEADLLVVRRSGWAEEVEIKISAADFRREWSQKAEKHEALEKGVRIPAGMIGHYQERYVDGVDVSADPTLHQGGYRHRPDIPIFWFVRRPSIIRRYWFAMPGKLADELLSEVPEQYGVIAVRHYNQILRKPKDLKQARKVTDAERLKALESTYHKFWKRTLAQVRHAGSAADPEQERAEALSWLLSLGKAVTS